MGEKSGRVGKRNEKSLPWLFEYNKVIDSKIAKWAFKGDGTGSLPVCPPRKWWVDLRFNGGGGGLYGNTWCLTQGKNP